MVDRVPIFPYTFLSMSAELSKDVYFLLQKPKRGEMLCGLPRGHSVCRAAPWDAKGFGPSETRINGDEHQAGQRRKEADLWQGCKPMARIPTTPQETLPETISFTKILKCLLYNHQTIYILYLNKTHLWCRCFIYSKR